MQRAAKSSLPTWLGALAFMRRKMPTPKLSKTYEREVFFVFALGLSAFYLVALSSFNPLDASPIGATFPEAAASNLAGVLGAELAGLAMFAFGAAGYVLPLPLLATAFLLLREKERPLGLGRTIGWTLAIAAVASILAARMPVISIKGFEIPSGGVIGESLVAAMQTWLGKIGGIIVFATAVLGSILLIFQRSLLAPTWGFVRGALASSHAPQKPDDGDNLRNEGRKGKRQESIQVIPIDQPMMEPTPDVAKYYPPVEVAVPLVVAPETEKIEMTQESAKGLFARFKKKGLQKDEVNGNDNSEDENSEDQMALETTAPKKQQYVTPPLSIFNTGGPASAQHSSRELETTGQLLVKTFGDFGVIGKIVGYQTGPVVTVYEFQPDAGVKQSKIIGLIDDVALALKVDSIFIHPVSGKRALGIQVPNSKRETVYLGDVLSTAGFQDANSTLTFGLGKTINGQPMCADLTTMPHLLMAGATGAGKSVAINALLCSVIMKATPSDVRMILVDPKMLELSVYDGIPHLLMPVITEPQRASLALKWAATEMERRYKLMQHACVRHISGFNTFWEQASKERKRELCQITNDDKIDKLPYILIVIDELADLMLMAPKDVETSIQRLAQNARASGIHMVLATQRPSVDIITGVIKANLPCRISFQVVSKHDSRTILDTVGSEKLLGKGDMLFQRPGVGRLERVQGALISDEEVLNLVAAAKMSAKAVYDDSIMSWIDDEIMREKSGDEDSDEPSAMDDDPKYDEAIGIAKAHGVVSASFLQRHLKIGYNRAARIVEFMEGQGLVAKADGSKPRRWLGPIN